MARATARANRAGTAVVPLACNSIRIALPPALSTPAGLGRLAWASDRFAQVIIRTMLVPAVLETGRLTPSRPYPAGAQPPPLPPGPVFDVENRFVPRWHNSYGRIQNRADNPRCRAGRPRWGRDLAACPGELADGKPVLWIFRRSVLSVITSAPPRSPGPASKRDAGAPAAGGTSRYPGMPVVRLSSDEQGAGQPHRGCEVPKCPPQLPALPFETRAMPAMWRGSRRSLCGPAEHLGPDFVAIFFPLFPQLRP